MASAATPKLVVDTSVVVAVLVNEPTRTAVMRATAGVVALAAPSLPWEVGNALVAMGRRKLMTAAEAVKAWEAFAEIPLRYVEIDVSEAVRRAYAHGIYAYDSYVLEVAEKAGAGLLSFDERQIQVARAMGLSVVEIMT